MRVEVAYEVVSRGWRALYNASAYAAAVRVDRGLLTIDSAFKGFLRRQGFEVHRLLSRYELERLLKAARLPRALSRRPPRALSLAS